MSKDHAAGYDRDFLLTNLKKMMTIRRLEEKCSQMYGLRKIGGFLHLYIGQEAVATGSIAALDLKKDYVYTAYRDHAHAFLCGTTPGAIMAELFGKSDGCSGGKGGSMHMFDYENHFFGGNGIVGAHIPLAAGSALKIKYLEEDGVVLCYFGDGAIHQGSFHETLNMAKIWNLPVIFICENNQYGMGTSYKRVSSVEDFSIMAKSYSIKGEQIEGMNFISVYEKFKEYVEYAREGNPAFLEVRTYRYKGHSASDPAKYRTKEELEHYKKQDPIIILKEDMERAGMLTDEEFNEMYDHAKKEATDATDFAEKSPEPALEKIYEDVLA